METLFHSRFPMFRTQSLINLLILSVVTVFLFTLIPAQVFASAVSADLNANNGYPLWYADDSNVQLEHCLAGSDANCVLPGLGDEPGFDPGLPTVLPTNFPSEFFWYNAESERTPTLNGGFFSMRFVVEGAFLNGDVVAGDQITFGRIRLTASGLQPNQTYTATHPYGVDTYTTDATGRVVRTKGTEDIGCFSKPCNFSQALSSRVFTKFLKWDSGAPTGYLGDAVTPHTVTGAPTGRNFVTLTGPGLPAGGLTQNMFTVSGKLFTGPPTCTASAPGQPQLNAPGNGVTGQTSSPTLSWQTLLAFGSNCNGNNNTYEVYLNAGNVTPTTSIGSVASTTTSLVASALASNTTYSWKVRANNGALFTDSPVFIFTTAAVTPPPEVVPAAPSGLTAQRNATGGQLQWTDNANNETSYQVQRQSLPSGAFSDLTTTLAVNSTSYSDTTLPTTGDFGYRVRACNTAGCSAYVNASVTTPPPVVTPPATTVPSAPVNLTAVRTVSGSKLNWTDTSGETRYQIQRRGLPFGFFANLTTTLAADSTSFTDTTVPSTGSFAYRIRACNSIGCSAFTTANLTGSVVTPPPVDVPPTTTLPSAPTSVTAVRTAQGSQLNWTDSTGETRYQIQRRTFLFTAFTNLTSTLAADSTSYADNTLGAGSWQYRIRACNALGCSAYVLVTRT